MNSEDTHIPPAGTAVRIRAKNLYTGDQFFLTGFSRTGHIDVLGKSASRVKVRIYRMDANEVKVVSFDRTFNPSDWVYVFETPESRAFRRAKSRSRRTVRGK
jgi:hypothetical protein